MSIKKAIIILVIIAVVGIIAVLVFTNGSEDVTYKTVKAELGNIIQTVSETGTVKADKEIDLNFLNSGRIAQILVSVGNMVVKDQLLAELEHKDLDIKKQEAEANLQISRENLNKLLAGATSHDITVVRAGEAQAKAAYESTKIELEKTKNSVDESIRQAEKTLADLVSPLSSNLTPTEQAVATAETNLNNTKASYQNALDDAIETALTTAEEKNTIANNALDAIDRVLTDEDAKDQLSKSNPDHKIATEGDYNEAQALLIGASNSLAVAKASNTSSRVLNAQENTIFLLNKVFSGLNNCFSALEHSITSSAFTQAELDAFKVTISTQQTAIATAISTIQGNKQTLADAILNYETKVAEMADALATAIANYEKAVLDAKNSLATAQLSGDSLVIAGESKVNTSHEAWLVAQAKLDQILAPASRYDVSLNQARVKQTEAALNNIIELLEHSKIYAPIDGTITRADYEKGEQVSAGMGAAISMLGKNDYEIEVLISEADIAKIEIKDLAEITLDAYGEDIKLNGEVFFIEPAETVVQDVIYYKVLISFDPLEYGVKSGMTANIILTTAMKNDVIIIPSRAVINRNGSGKYVRILQGKNVDERSIVLGLRGDEGMVEVLDGIKAGETVVTSIINSK
ncbi:efflux RND transporter periplasmic adaptor subunit [Candidatus Parcubacteria bacterium]|nr:efflux RND transporter periplasmic adaptor subunit [Candidatus Parcubacteria bacterium]